MQRISVARTSGHLLMRGTSASAARPAFALNITGLTAATTGRASATPLTIHHLAAFRGFSSGEGLLNAEKLAALAKDDPEHDTKTPAASMKQEGEEKTTEDGELLVDAGEVEDTRPTFQSLNGISKTSLDILASQGLVHPTEIQHTTFPDLFQGRDLIGRSHTGTGKTIAFALPLLERLNALIKADKTGSDRGRKIGMVVLAPTRELAKQVSSAMEPFANAMRLSVSCFYGGSPYAAQERDIRRGIDVLVGTPGRIIDHIERGNLDLSGVKISVLDEADEMLSMGFQDEVENIFAQLPAPGTRQTVLFSATLPTWVSKIASTHLVRPVTYDAVGRDTNRTASTVKHVAMKVPHSDESRASVLEDIVTAYSGNGKVLIFTQSKAQADALVGSPGYIGRNAQALHGDMNQRQRETTLAQFRDGNFKILIATDVAARGVDIKDMDLVIQFSIPMETERYIHRAGRTGRAGKAGTCIVLYSAMEMRRLRMLESLLKMRFTHAFPPTLKEIVKMRTASVVAAVPKVDPAVLSHFKDHAKTLLDEYPPERLNDLVSSLLAISTNTTALTKRGLISCKPDHVTVQMKTKGRGGLRVPQVLWNLNDWKRAGINISPESVGDIHLSADGNAALFDLPKDQADALAKADPATLGNMAIEFPTQLPALQPRDGGGRDGGREFGGRDFGGRDGGRDGGRYGGRDGGRYERNGGRFDRDGGRDGGDRRSFGRPSQGRRDNEGSERSPRPYRDFGGEDDGRASRGDREERSGGRYESRGKFQRSERFDRDGRGSSGSSGNSGRGEDRE